MNEKYKFKLGRDYESRNQSAIDDLTNQYTNRQFSYDADTDAAYQDYAKMMRESGYKAMQDTVAHASALTGGYGNSYAATAGQQVYNDYAKQIGAAQADFYDRALANFNSEGNDLLSKIGVLENRENADRALWEEDYTRAWNEAEQRANHGDVSELAGLLDIDTATVQKSLGYGEITPEIEQGLIDALNNENGDEYLRSLVAAGYDTENLVEMAKRLQYTGKINKDLNFEEDKEAKGDYKYKITYTDKPKIDHDAFVVKESVNKSVEGEKFSKKAGGKFHIARKAAHKDTNNTLANPSSYGGDDGKENWYLEFGKELEDDDSVYTPLINSGKSGVVLYNDVLYYIDGDKVLTIQARAEHVDDYNKLLKFMKDIYWQQNETN